VIGADALTTPSIRVLPERGHRCMQRNMTESPDTA
jgi:hypothetical protein